MSEMIVVLLAVFFINKSGVNFEEPHNVNLLRISFCTVSVIDVLVNIYIYKILQSRIQKDEDDYNKKELFFPGPPNPFDPTPKYDPKARTTAVYEQEKSAQFLQQTLGGMLIIGILHCFMGIVQPLAIRSVLVPVQLFKNPMVQMYIFGSTADANPWQALEQLPENAEASEPSPPPPDADTDPDPLPDTPTPPVAEAKQTEDTCPEVESLAGDIKEEISRIASGEEEQPDFSWLIQALEAHPSLVDTQTEETGLTATMAAARFASDEALESLDQLVELGGSLFVQDNAGCTALHHAVEADNLKAVTILLNQSDIAGILDVPSKTGETVLDVATHDAMLQLLNSHRTGEPQPQPQPTTGLRLRRKKAEAKAESEDNSVEDID